MFKQTPLQVSCKFHPKLVEYIRERIGSFDTIPGTRKEDLAKVVSYIRDHVAKSLPTHLTFICTHNSRRSHFAQIWAHIAAECYGIPGVKTFSGGTEATAFNPSAVAALRRCGLKITCENLNVVNPRYLVHTSEDAEPLICFSKVYDAPPNPTKGYCAIMTCSQADETCPIVAGCEFRIPIRYEDPKVADGTELEAQKYDERSAQICTEMLYLMSLI
jgi:arsenate reductase